jgi:hypothetical protein
MLAQRKVRRLPCLAGGPTNIRRLACQIRRQELIFSYNVATIIRPPRSPSAGAVRISTLLLALGSTATCALCWQWPEVLNLLGIGHGGLWFLDLKTLLYSIAVQRHGIDPYTLPYDIQHWYSHWWLLLEFTGVTRSDNIWLGMTVSGLTVLTIWLVARPRCLKETVWTLAVFCSAPILLGLNRANIDLILFIVLSLCVPALMSSRRSVVIVVAPLLIAFATGLKYYPAVAGLVLLTVRPPRDRAITILFYATLLTLVFVSVAGDIRHYTNADPIQGIYTFGAPALTRLIGLQTAGGLMFSMGVLFVSGFGIARSAALKSRAFPPELKAEYLSFMLGAVILAGCFVASTNYAYRWIFAFWMLPFLCRLQPGPSERALRWLRNATRALLIAALWIECGVVVGLNLIRHTEATNAAWQSGANALTQGVTWLLFACLSGWLVHFVLTQWRDDRRDVAASDSPA